MIQFLFSRGAETGCDLVPSIFTSQSLEENIAACPSELQSRAWRQNRVFMHCVDILRNIREAKLGLEMDPDGVLPELELPVRFRCDECRTDYEGHHAELEEVQKEIESNKREISEIEDACRRVGSIKKEISAIENARRRTGNGQVLERLKRQFEEKKKVYDELNEKAEKMDFMGELKSRQKALENVEKNLAGRDTTVCSHVDQIEELEALRFRLRNKMKDYDKVTPNRKNVNFTDLDRKELFPKYNRIFFRLNAVDVTHTLKKLTAAGGPDGARSATVEIRARIKAMSIWHDRSLLSKRDAIKAKHVRDGY